MQALTTWCDNLIPLPSPNPGPNPCCYILWDMLYPFSDISVSNVFVIEPKGTTVREMTPYALLRKLCPVSMPYEPFPSH